MMKPHKSDHDNTAAHAISSNPAAETHHADIDPWNDVDQWEIDRYVMNDESLDRGEFEARMALDESLAIRVATAVEELQQFTSACRELRIRERQAEMPREPNLARHSQRFSLLATVAAACLLLGLGLHYGWRISVTRPVDNMAVLADVAEQWLVFESAFAIDDSLQVMDALAEEASSFDFIQPGEVATDENDWLVDAAREFYREIES